MIELLYPDPHLMAILLGLTAGAAWTASRIVGRWIWRHL